MNTLPTDNLDKRVRNRALAFSTESGDEAGKVMRALAEGRKTGGETTGGHWKRSVE